MSYQTPYRRDKIDVQVFTDDGAHWRYIFPGALSSATKGETYRDSVRAMLTPKLGYYAVYRIVRKDNHIQLGTAFDMATAINLADSYLDSYIEFRQSYDSRESERRASYPDF